MTGEQSQSQRTQAEILARFMWYQHNSYEDFMGFSRGVLIEAMTRETLLNDVKLDDISADWAPVCVEDTARAYLIFAIEKILDHRGVSASRSVSKMREYAWLLGRDDIVQTMNDADYTNYGAPKIKTFADKMGYAWMNHFNDDDLAQFNRMADGLSCVPDCNYGCGQ